MSPDIAAGIESLSAEEQRLLAEFLRRSERKVLDYIPYGHPDTMKLDGWSKKPWQWDFHALGKTKTYRLLSGANRVGKTLTICREDYNHTTGIYPDWWPGKKFDHPVDWMVCGETNETTRDILQRTLIGDEKKGIEGLIPPDRILDRSTRSANVEGLYDEVTIAHENMHEHGRPSVLQFKSYSQGWSKFQGVARHGIHMDEEPDPGEKKQTRIFKELQMRIVSTDGILMAGFTSNNSLIHGRTDLVSFFKDAKKSDSRAIVEAGWNDVLHLSEKAKRAGAEGLTEEELAVRTQGKIIDGVGTVVVGNRYEIEVDPFEIPSYFPQIVGIDFGFAHPQGYARIVRDPTTNIRYLVDCYAIRKKLPAYHAEAIKSRCSWAPVAWPHDGLKGHTGQKTWKEYLERGVPMLPMSARWDAKKGGSQGVEDSYLELNQLIESGLFKVFATCEPFFEEMGKIVRNDKYDIVDRNDDVIKAVQYALMMERYSMSEDMARPTLATAYNSPMIF